MKIWEGSRNSKYRVKLNIFQALCNSLCLFATSVAVKSVALQRGKYQIKSVTSSKVSQSNSIY
jgi:hypothetical protein